MQQKRILLTALFSALVIVGAYIRIPLPPVPITLQTLFVLLAGFLGGTRMAVASTAIYLLLGMVGLPVFTSGGGLGILFGPTGGFLLGLLPASLLAGIAGNMKQKSERPKRYLLLCILTGLAATITVYLVGVPYLKYTRSLSWQTALKVGMLPFLIGDLLKVAAAAHLAKTFHERTEQFKA
ncbi:MAG: biotin transporter BioY [Spirochaetia bacterium]|nr:biotin transporter BioY [Sphaerochaeta sp.]NCC11752.1 biotin transporter BioY [Spirochaetia bacterium]NCC89488.1 biotin transporter BioY [Spirochaetia bacterium]